MDYASNASTKGEALLLRTLPLISPITSVYPFSTTPFFNGSVRFKDIYFPVLDALIISAADGTASRVYEKVRPVAQECIVSWCVKKFQSSYAEGSYEKTVTRTYMNSTGAHQPYPWEGFPHPYEGQEAFAISFQGDITIRPPGTDPNPPSYGVSNGTFIRTQALFDDMFPISMTVANLTAPAWWRVKIYAWARNQLRLGAEYPWLAPHNITDYFERLSTSMTNVIRSHRSHEFVRGRANTQTTFIAVHLQWLTFPLVLLFFSLIFLIATMVKTSKGTDGEMSTWKTSAMPTLLFSLPKDTQAQFGSQGIRKSSLKKRRKSIKIRLHPNQGWRVSGQNHASLSPIRNYDPRLTGSEH